MKYLTSFSLPGERAEAKYLLSNRKLDMSCYATNNVYPFKLFPQKRLTHITFEPLTIFYGGNGSGKSTLLNLIAEKWHLHRLCSFQRTPFFDDYLSLCEGEGDPSRYSSIITSDAVFDYLLDLRAINDGVDRNRNAVFEEWRQRSDPNAHMQLRSLEEYEEFKEFLEAKRLSMNKYTERRIARNVIGRSNGESAYAYFTELIKEDALYLLDEPENSLSAELQQRLAQFLEDSVRFFGCQLVICTHSPFLLSLKGARIYNLDHSPVDVCRWTELGAVQAYRSLFVSRSSDFEST
ncbi:MAG: AAA family ATPase [Clostridia bacterium]|nr:AAA family ATPase [Clostridia bacterium]